MAKVECRVHRNGRQVRRILTGFSPPATLSGVLRRVADALEEQEFDTVNINVQREANDP